jgi:hypothetical protein
MYVVIGKTKLRLNDIKVSIKNAIPGSQTPICRDPARFFNTEIPVLRWPITEIFGTAVRAHSKRQKRVKHCYQRPEQLCVAGL